MFAFIGSHFDILVIVTMSVFAATLLYASVDDAIRDRSASRNR